MKFGSPMPPSAAGPTSNGESCVHQGRDQELAPHESHAGHTLRSSESQWKDQRGTGCRPGRHPLHRIHTCKRPGSSRIRPMPTLGVVRARAGRPERHWAPYTGTHLASRCRASTPAILRSWGYCWRSGTEASSPAFRLRRLAGGRAELSLSEYSHKTSFQTGK